MNDHRITAALHALQGFFGGFLPAYAEGCAPDAAELPYITYSPTVPDTLGEAPLRARVWYRGRGYAEIAAILDAIAQALGPGLCLPVEGGALWLYPSEAFAQLQPAQADDGIKCATLNMKTSAIF